MAYYQTIVFHSSELFYNFKIKTVEIILKRLLMGCFYEDELLKDLFEVIFSDRIIFLLDRKIALHHQIHMLLASLRTW